MITKIMIEVRIENPFKDVREDRVYRAYQIAKEFYNVYQGNGESKPLTLSRVFTGIEGSPLDQLDLPKIEVEMQGELQLCIMEVKTLLANAYRFDKYKERL